MDAALQIDGLRKYFGSTKAVDGIDLAVQVGEVFGFLGPNGAGKTTTIRMIMDFLRADEGHIRLFGQPMERHGVAARSRIGYMPPVTSLNERWTGRDHIRYARALRGTKDRADELVKRLGLDERKTAKQLSTGNRQKLSLVLAFMFNPDLIILDEPTNGLDPLLQQTVYSLIEEAHQRGATIFMSSHNLAEIERTCTRVGILRQGKLIAVETMASLQDKHLYTVQLWFDRDIDAAHLDLPRATVTHTEARTVILKYSGEIQPLLDVVAHLKPHDVAINHATLEEHFMTFYNHRT